MTVSSATYLVAASCILHNICELRRDDFLENCLDEVHQPDNITLTGENDEAESDAASIRDVLAQFFLTAESLFSSVHACQRWITSTNVSLFDSSSKQHKRCFLKFYSNATSVFIQTVKR